MPRCGCGSRARTASSRSPSGTKASAYPRPTCRTSSSASAVDRTWPSAFRGQGSGSPRRGRSSSCTAARSRSRAPKERDPRSPCVYRSTARRRRARVSARRGSGRPALLALAVLDVRSDLLEETVLRHVADETLRLLTVLEQDHRGDRAHAVAPRGDGVRVHVELRDLQRLAALGGDLLQDGRDHATRAAPRGPEVDQHRTIGPNDLLLEGLVTDRDGLGHWLHRLLSTAAAATSRRATATS